MKHEEPDRYRNYYECPECGIKWNDSSPYTNNDRCPECKAETEPYDSEDLSVSEFQTYIKTGGCRCPYCGSDEIEGSDFDIDETGVRQEVFCNNCQKDWTDVYTLSGIIESDGNIIDKKEL